MDIRQIQYFIRVYEERSFSRAAEKANVVQPALSMQIRRLEEELTTPLFERSSRGIEPTAAGTRFYELCLPIVHGLAEARQEIIDFAGGTRISGRIHVGCPPSVNRGIIGEVLARYADLYPNVEVTLTEGYSNTLTALVQDGVLDVAFAAKPADGSGLASTLAFEDRLLLVAGTAVNGDDLTPCRLTEMRALKLILPSRRTLLGAAIFDYIDSGVIRPERVMHIDGVVATLELARASDWSAIFPVVSMAREAGRQGLFIYPIIAPAMSFSLHLVHDRRRPLTAALRAFTEMVGTRLDEIADIRSVLFSAADQKT